MSKCAFDIGGVRCIALNKMACQECSFRQTEEELKQGREKSNARISTLPDEQQEKIFDLYLNGENRKKWEVAERHDKRRKHQAACAH